MKEKKISKALALLISMALLMQLVIPVDISADDGPAVPLLQATVAPGTVSGSTKVTVTDAVYGDESYELVVNITVYPVDVPAPGDPVPTEGDYLIADYQPGTDITEGLAVNKQLQVYAVYEAGGQRLVAAFYQKMLVGDDMNYLTAVGSDGNSYLYKNNGDGTATITGFDDGSATKNIIIPGSVGGLTVSTVGDAAFSGLELTGVTIPDSVTAIGDGAFYGCISLTSISIPDSVTFIGSSVFLSCRSLTSISIPDSVTFIGSRAFSGCSGLTNISIPNSVTSIGTYMFSGCSGLTSISIPFSVTSIGSSAFSDCSGLTSISIPFSVTSIGSNAFDGCSGLTSINIPLSVTSIGSAAFYGCSGLTGISIPFSVTSIGDYAFRGCSGLESVIISDSMTSIGKEVFYGCSALTSISIPVGVVSIGDYAFYNCSSLESITIPGSVASIGNQAFSGCSTLTSVIIPVGVTSIGYNIFSDCTSLTSVTIPSSVTSIGIQAFLRCSSLESVIIPDSVTSIGINMFFECSGLTSVIIPDSVTSIGHQAFFHCSSLTSVSIPASVTTIEDSMFYGCSGLTSVSIPAGVTSIEDFIFGGCSSLASIAFLGSVPPEFGSDVFWNVPAGLQVYVPAGTVSSYADALAGELPSDAVIKEMECVDIQAISGITVPVRGAVPVASIAETAQYTGTVEWNPVRYPISNPFAASTVYTATITLTPKTGYTLTGVAANFFTVAGAMSVSNAADSGVIMATFPATSAVRDNSGGDGDSGSGSGGTSAPPAAPPAQQRQIQTTTTGNTATVTTIATTDSSGKANAAVTQAQVSDAIARAAAAAQGQGAGTAAVVEIKVEAPANAKTVETSIPQNALGLIAENGTMSLTVSSPVASLTFDADALSTIAGEAAGDIRITTSTVEASALSAEAQKFVSDRPVFDFSVTSGGRTISQFGGNVTVSVPYTPRAGEDLNAIVIYYINAEGDPVGVSDCRYDDATGTVIFSTNHFSRYAVGYNKVSFKDVAESVWYGKAVCFIAARGITAGTGNGYYSPEAKLTRGEFVVMMMKSYGIAPDANPKDNFVDAGSTYYTGYLAAAKRLGVSGGVGNNMFAPEKEITRQEMFTLLYNALKAVGKLPQGNAGKSLSSFIDAGDIASWAKDAMTLMTQTGTAGGSGGKLSPAATTTRAEMAKVLYNLLSK